MRNPDFVFEALDLLQRAKALIEHPSKWCKGTRARNAKHQPVPADCSEACMWDTSGALDKIGASEHIQVRARSYLAEAAWDLKARSFVDVNDYRTHTEVMAMWDRAIQKALFDIANHPVRRT